MPVTIMNDFVGDPRNHTGPTNREKFVLIRVNTWIVVTISYLLSTILLGGGFSIRPSSIRITCSAEFELVDKDDLLPATDLIKLGLTQPHPSFRIGATLSGRP